MAMCYVAHKYGGDYNNLRRARKIVHDLQVENTQDCFICPLLAFSHLKHGEIGFDAEMELCFDLLSVCDTLIVASEMSEGVQMEVDFANLVGMEVIWLDED